MAAKPKYQVIYEWLSAQITGKTFRPGDKIPGESELARMFGVHRMTVRQAIDKLVGDHILVRKRGRGTFLLSEKSPVLTRALENITTYHADIVGAGLEPRYVTLEAAIMPASQEEAENLGLSPGDPVVSLYRLMLASGVPLVLERSRLPAELFPGILEHRLDVQLYDVVGRVYPMHLIHSRQEIGAVLPTRREAELLQIAETCPCIWVESVVFNDEGRAVEFSRALHRGDKYRFTCSIGHYVCDNPTPA
ncbi:GntR family transcriptional regulator [Fundidesulfovibrio butyratiphilus]